MLRDDQLSPAGREIRKRLKARGKHQKWLCDDVVLSQTTLTRIMKKGGPAPDQLVAKLLSKRLGDSISYWMSLKDEFILEKENNRHNEAPDVGGVEWNLKYKDRIVIEGSDHIYSLPTNMDPDLFMRALALLTGNREEVAVQRSSYTSSDDQMVLEFPKLDKTR